MNICQKDVIIYIFIRKILLCNLIICAFIFINPTLSEENKNKIVIAIQPFENFNANYIEKIKSGIIETYGNIEIKVLSNKDLPKSAYYAKRNRYRAEILLDYLNEIVDKHHTKILGLTMKDISTTKGKYYDWGIFGLGELGGKACIVSIYRLKRNNPSEKLLYKRITNVVNHELGHTFGLGHCPEPGCLMEDAKGTIKTVDTNSDKFCDKCKKELYK